MTMTEAIEKKVYYFPIDENTAAGMTHKNAGDFYPDSNEKAIELAKKTLEIIGFRAVIYPKLIIMRAGKHSDEIVCFPDNRKLKTIQSFCDGAIYRGTGGVIFYPGGCPAISFRDAKANLSGMLHGGWKSITKGIVEKFINKWQMAGGKPQNTTIKFLPSICNKCLTYEEKYFYSIVYPSLHALLNNKKATDRFYSRNNEKINFCLNFLIEHLLVEKGYYNKILTLSECTCCNHGKYWCYRRDDKDGKKHRNAAFIITAPLFAF